MDAKYHLGQRVQWYTGPCIILKIATENGEIIYELKHTEFYLCCHATEEQLLEFQENIPDKFYQERRPHLIIVDNFYCKPETIREVALKQVYQADEKRYKGKRTFTRFLLPGLKERFESLIGATIVNWLEYDTNGIFQITKYTDPLVWHSDLQSYAAAIYLTPNAPVTAGTSFWRDRKYGCRRPPFHEQEKDRFTTDLERELAQNEIYSPYNLLHPDNWELVDRAGALFNRLVIWDSQMIHSASSYEGFNGINEAENSRLVQLFFFDVIV